jgi:hypothetical protein
VWIQNGRLYVADTQNNRVLIYNHIPTTNGVAADVVLGQPNFTTVIQPDLTQQKNNVSAAELLNPVAVSSDGLHIFVTDLGFNRVLIWNSIPTSNGAAADVAIGQPDLISSVANNGFSTDPNDTTVPPKQTPVLCPVTNGTDINNNPTYPASCNATVSFPRFALAAGNRLFIADGGNDRVLVFNTIPTQSGASADFIIGQIGGSINQASDAADSLRTPMSLAWDGTNLYVSDAYNRRVTVYSVGANTIPYAGVVNAASLNIVARARVTIAGAIQAADAIDINIGGTQSTDSAGTVTTTGGADYKYSIVSTDTISTIVTALASLINAANSGAGDTNVYATPDLATGDVLLTSRIAGTAGNNMTLYGGYRRQHCDGGANHRHCQQHHMVRRRRRGGDCSRQHRLGDRLQPLLPHGVGRPQPESAAQQTRRHAGLLQRHSGTAHDGLTGQGERADSLGTWRHHQYQRVCPFGER